ncbi:hypothetical protein F0562_005644 [Nyssa sinensis]|uniref:Retrotransposon gag domain-containing protein n=1 Tax=Nyssa sinensis TaxID=561372 RepID=A0A5J5AN92_9ASTE|nr:hypothetical protein F0562_005644 [Nyssa sinensis]
MLIALNIKNKVGFIDGTVSKPSDLAAAFQWTRCNNMVKAWLLNSLSKDISTSVINCDLAKDIWVELKEYFSQVNGPLMFQLEQEIHNLVQSTSFVTTYFTKLKRLWDELLSLQSHLIHEGIPSHRSIASMVSFFKRRLKETSKHHHPLDGVALAAKGILPSPKDHKAPPRKKSLKCTHCHKDDHTIDRCYFIHGFPPGPRKTRPNYKSSAYQVSSITNTPSTSSFPFTLDQCQQLLTMVTNATQSSSMANRVGNAEHSLLGWIANEIDCRLFLEKGCEAIDCNLNLVDDSIRAFSIPTLLPLMTPM